MAFTPATETELPTLTPPATAAAAREPEDVEYPEGNWIAQSIWHGKAVSQATVALDNHFRNRENVLVAMELLVYYEPGNNKVCLQPDLQVVFGVQRGNRSSYKVWEEGKAADFVLEVASPSTADKDAQHKAQEYARIGVREYWRLDPTGSLLATPLQGWEANGESYHPVHPVASGARSGWLRSRSWGWSCAANGRTGRQCWCSGIRARGKSSTGIWQNRSDCGGQRKSAPVPRRNSDSPRRNVRVPSRNARVRRPSVDGQQRSERGHWRSNSGHSLLKAVRRNASLSSQGQESSAGRPVQYQASPSRERPFQPQEMADWASPQASPRAHNACHIQEFVTSDSCPKLLGRIHRFFGPPLRMGQIGNQDQVCI